MIHHIRLRLKIVNQKLLLYDYLMLESVFLSYVTIQFTLIEEYNR